jgi:hypothetical protein
MSHLAMLVVQHWDSHDDPAAAAAVVVASRRKRTPYQFSATLSFNTIF